MEFKIGDKVVLDNTRVRDMHAKIGATAVVYATTPCSLNCRFCRTMCIQIKWIDNELRRNQQDGCYRKSMFKLINKQLEFSFMNEK